MEVPRSGVCAWVDDGVEFLADLPSGVEGQRIHGEQAAGRRVDSGGLDGQRHVGKGGESFLAGRGPVLPIGLLFICLVGARARLRGAGVR